MRTPDSNDADGTRHHDKTVHRTCDYGNCARQLLHVYIRVAMRWARESLSVAVHKYLNSRGGMILKWIDIESYKRMLHGLDRWLTRPDSVITSSILAVGAVAQLSHLHRTPDQVRIASICVGHFR